jgi:RNA polymerase sigma factor (sigma-70 family)
MNALAIHRIFNRAPPRQRQRAPNPVREQNASAIGPRADDERARFTSAVLSRLDDAYTLARWLTGSAADAEVVVEGACLRAFRAIGSFANGDARAWVLTIVRHSAYARLRKNRPTALAVVGDANTAEHRQADAASSGIQTPEAPLIADAARLKDAIAALPIPLREAVVLRDIQGLHYREIAEVTEAPIGTVLSRLACGRRQLIATIECPPTAARDYARSSALAATGSEPAP